MNFKMMPELNWQYGYLVAIVLMVLSSFGTLVYFKKRRWL
jgi:magnesium transporter